MIKRFFCVSILFALLVVLSTNLTSCRFSQAFHSQPVRVYDNPVRGYSAPIDSNDYIQLKPPDQNQATTSATVFLESVDRIARPDTAFIIIRGNFSNGCSHLQNVTHSIENHVLRLNFEAWRPKDEMCTQVLTPFSYLYTAIPAEEIQALRSYIKQGKKIPF